MTDEWYVILNMNCKYEICRRCPKSGLFKGSLKECDDWIKQKQKDEIKDKISMALKDKDPLLQQGFEIICKENNENVEIKKQLTKAKEILRKFLDAKSIEDRCVVESEAEHFLNGEVYL